MSSNIRIVKSCEYCKNDFVAKTTVTKCCSDDCAKRLYKLKKRNSKIAQAELKTAVKSKPEAYIKEEEIKVIQAKERLTLKEAALLLNVTRLTLRRWVLEGKKTSEKIGKKHIFEKNSLFEYKILISNPTRD